MSRIEVHFRRDFEKIGEVYDRDRTIKDRTFKDRKRDTKLSIPDSTELLNYHHHASNC